MIIKRASFFLLNVVKNDLIFFANFIFQRLLLFVHLLDLAPKPLVFLSDLIYLFLVFERLGLLVVLEEVLKSFDFGSLVFVVIFFLDEKLLEFLDLFIFFVDELLGVLIFTEVLFDHFIQILSVCVDFGELIRFS